VRVWHIQNVVLFLLFLFGIVIGSFLNVCIARIPEGMSIVSPGSRCPRCLTAIRWYDNVPVFGWLWLRGKCRSCGLPISVIYPIVEFVTGALFVGCYLRFGLSPDLVKWLFFSCLLVVLTVTDLLVRILPDLVNWPGTIVGLFFSAAIPPNDGTALMLTMRLFHRIPSPRIVGLLDGLLGAAFGSLALLGVATAYKAVRGREGMGMGDVKMMAMIGSFLGLRGTFFTMLAGSLLGTVIGLSIAITLYAAGWKRRLAERASRRGLGKVSSLRWAIASRYQLPLGTFLGIAALVVMFILYEPTAVYLPHFRR